MLEGGLGGGAEYRREVAVRVDAFRVVDYYLLNLCAGSEKETALHLTRKSSQRGRGIHFEPDIGTYPEETPEHPNGGFSIYERSSIDGKFKEGFRGSGSKD